MKSIGLEELKQIQLDILLDVADFCEKNGICYFLAAGTLLGAVRHKGYIPWDDDIDISMPRPDYERFKKEYNSPGKRYYFLDSTIDKDYPYTFGKVCDNDTLLIENFYKLGVYIDIFQIDGLPDDKGISDNHCNKIKRHRNYLALKSTKWRKGRSLYKNLFLIVSKVPLLFANYRLLLSRTCRLMAKYDYGLSSFAANLNFGGPSRRIEREVFDDIVKVSFENHQLNAPIGYEKWLINLFGDYMTLPPEKDRVSTHVFEAFWKDKE